MQAAECLNVAGRAAGRAFRGACHAVEAAVGLVNPDVWRELGYASLLSYSVLVPRREPILELEDDGCLPVVLVHGLASNRGTWYPLRLFLSLLGHRRVYAFGYEAGTIEGHGKALEEFVQQVKQTCGSSQVNMVAHSMGGIISRYAIQRLGLADSVRTLITLATPHQGTCAAIYANSHLTRQLRPDSPLVLDLNGDDLSRLPVRFVTVSSDRDIYVLPHVAMTLPGAENIFVPEISHTQHIVSLQVFRIVAAALEPVRQSRRLSTGVPS